MTLVETIPGARTRGSGPIFRDVADGSAPSRSNPVGPPITLEFCLTVGDYDIANLGEVYESRNKDLLRWKPKRRPEIAL